MQLSTAVFSSFHFSSDDSHFHSVPFRLKFLWLELIVLATANCRSTRPNCDRKEEAENVIDDKVSTGWEKGDSRIVLELPSFSPLKLMFGNSRLLRILTNMSDDYTMNWRQYF